MDFSIWTREDFVAFDTRRSEVFSPTPEEADAQRLESLRAVDAKVSAVLSRIGLELPETVDRDFLLEVARRLDIKQFVGENYEAWVDEQIRQVPPPLDCLRYFISRYL